MLAGSGIRDVYDNWATSRADKRVPFGPESHPRRGPGDRGRARNASFQPTCWTAAWIGAQSLRLSAVGRQYSSTYRSRSVADQESNDIGDRLRLNGGGEHLRREQRLVLLGGDYLRGDGVHPDTAWSQLEVEGAYQVNEGCLGDSVRRIAGCCLDARPSRYMHDHARALLFHVRHDRLREPQCGADVDLHQLAQLFRGDAERVAQFESADRVDQDVRGADLGSDSLQERSRHIGVGAVGDFQVDPFGKLFQPRFVAVDGDDSDTDGVQRLRGGRAEATSGTGHDCDTSAHDRNLSREGVWSGYKLLAQAMIRY